jgi:hypothetical protein
MRAYQTLAGRFLSLSYLRRHEVASELGLVQEGDEKLDTMEWNRAIMVRAKDKGLIPRLWDAIEAKHGDGLYPDNPFK